MPRPRKEKPAPPPEIVEDLQEALYRYIGKGTRGALGYRPFSLERMLEVAAANGLADKMTEWMEVRGVDNAPLRMLLANQLRKVRRGGRDLVIGPYTVPAEEYAYVPSNGPAQDPYRFRPRAGAKPQPRPKRSLTELLAELETYPEEPDHKAGWTPTDIRAK